MAAELSSDLLRFAAAFAGRVKDLLSKNVLSKVQDLRIADFSRFV